MMLGIANEKIASMIVLKYGEDIINIADIITDYTPIIGKDYYPSATGREDGLVYVRPCQALSG